MIKKALFWFIIVFFLGGSYCNSFGFILAAESPNNKFGIHLAQPHDQDLEAAAKLVNSSGGDWGYVTLVIQENDRDSGKWQDIFNKLRRLRLIPIIRLATKPEGDKWRRPSKEEAGGWVDFLDSLNWVIKDRYIILFNEPNHAQEWGGEVDAENYAEVAKEFAEKLKAKNRDFFIMLAGFDAAAPHQPPNFEDEEIFLRRIHDLCKDRAMPCPYNYIDGLSSHSYPNPGFTGGPYDSGRNSIRNYQWERAILKEIGVTKELPVFITETGWPHNENSRLRQGYGGQSKNQKSNFYSPESTAEYFKIAFENVWLTDDRIKAVTPFVLNYQGEPFADFSWALPGREDFYPQYYAVQKIQKAKGEPEQKHKVTVSAELPQELVEKSTYNFRINIENQGQSILDKNYKLKVNGFESFFSDLNDLEPFNDQTVDFHLKTTDKLGNHEIKIGLFKDNKLILDTFDGAKRRSVSTLSGVEGVDLFAWDFKVSPWPSLSFKVNLFPKLKTEGTDFELQIFDKNEQLVYKKTKVSITNSKGSLERIGNIALNESYRIVVLKPYYLPRQSHLIFKKNKNEIVFNKMLPLDFNKDGRLSLSDIISLLKHLSLLRLWWVK